MSVVINIENQQVVLKLSVEDSSAAKAISAANRAEQSASDAEEFKNSAQQAANIATDAKDVAVEKAEEATGAVQIINSKRSLVRIGYASDLHNAPTGTNSGGRYRLDAHEKLREAIDYWNKKRPDFVVINGDLIDGVAVNGVDEILDIEPILDELEVPRYYSLGNHDVHTNSKSEFIANTTMEFPYYSFNNNGVHFIVLDSCYSEDNDDAGYDNGVSDYTQTYINPSQRVWLEADLAATDLKTVVFLHHRLDNDPQGLHHVINREAVRSILESSKKVLAVFQGHQHINNKSTINSIDYYTMEAMTDGAFPSNAYALISINPDDTIKVEGFGNQSSYNNSTFFDFGLGIFANTNKNQISNLNTHFTSGLFSAPSTAIGGPYKDQSGGSGQLIHLVYAESNTHSQIFFRNNSDLNITARNYISGSWTPWKEILKSNSTTQYDNAIQWVKNQGIGDASIVMNTDGDSLNDINKNCFVYAGFRCINTPYVGGSGFVITHKYIDGYLLQHHISRPDGNINVRTKEAGVWGAWKRTGGGATGTFTSNDGKTITVTNGLITAII